MIGRSKLILLSKIHESTTAKNVGSYQEIIWTELMLEMKGFQTMYYIHIVPQIIKVRVCIVVYHSCSHDSLRHFGKFKPVVCYQWGHNLSFKQSAAILLPTNKTSDDNEHKTEAFLRFWIYTLFIHKPLYELKGVKKVIF